MSRVLSDLTIRNKCTQIRVISQVSQKAGLFGLVLVSLLSISQLEVSL
jgi:hypothetical protein